MAQDLPKFECKAGYILRRRHLMDFHSPEPSGVIGLDQFHVWSRGKRKSWRGRRELCPPSLPSPCPQSSDDSRLCCDSAAVSPSLHSCSFSFDVMKRAAPARPSACSFFARCIHDERVQVRVHSLAHHNLHPVGESE